MITFNGISITDVAPVDIADIVVGTVKRSAVTRQRPIRPGAEFVRITDQTRTVNITLAVRTNDEETRLDEIEAINAWAASTEPGKLVLPYRGGKYLNAICTQYIEPSYRQWWETKLKLAFTCYDPYFCDPVTKQASVGSTETTIAITGSAEPEMKIWQIPVNDETTLSWTVNGSTVTIASDTAFNQCYLDINKQKIVSIMGDNLAQCVTLGSQFPEFSKSMSITTTASGLTVWRERYV